MHCMRQWHRFQQTCYSGQTHVFKRPQQWSFYSAPSLPKSRSFATAPSLPLLSLDALYGHLKHLSRTRQWQQCVDLVRNHPRHTSLDHRFYDRVITIVGLDCGQFDAAWDVYRLMLERGVKPDSALMTTLANVTVKARNVDLERRRRLVQEMLSDMQRKYSLRPSASTMNMLLSLLLQDGHRKKQRNKKTKDDSAKGEDVDSSKEKKNYSARKESVIGKEDTMPSLGQYERAVATFMALRTEYPFEPDLQTYTILLQHVLQREPSPAVWRQVAEILHQMDHEGIVKDTVFFNTLISAAVRTGSSHSMFTLIELMEESGCNPNVVTINTLLNNMAEIGDEHVFDVFEMVVEMSRQQLSDDSQDDPHAEPSETIQGEEIDEEDENLISGDDDDHYLSSLFRVLRRTGSIEINTVTYTTMIKSCVQLMGRTQKETPHELVNRAWRYIIQMVEDEITVDSIVLSHFLTLLKRHMELVTAPVVRGRYRAQSNSEKRETVITKETEHVKDMASRVVEMARENHGHRVPINVINAAMNLFVECYAPDMVLDICERIEPMEANSITLNTALKACRQMHEMIPVDTCLDIFQRFKQHANSISFVMMFDICTRHRDQELFRTVFAEWIKTSDNAKDGSELGKDFGEVQRVYRSMVNAATTLMPPEQVMALVRQLSSEGALQMDAAMCSILIKACTRHMEVEKGLQWHEEIKTRGDVTLDETYYTQLLELCEVHADVALAKRFIEEMQQEFNLQPNLHTYYALLQVMIRAARLGTEYEEADSDVESCMEHIRRCAEQLARDATVRHQQGIFSSPTSRRTTTLSSVKKIITGANSLYERWKRGMKRYDSSGKYD